MISDDRRRRRIERTTCGKEVDKDEKKIGSGLDANEVYVIYDGVGCVTVTNISRARVR